MLKDQTIQVILRYDNKRQIFEPPEFDISESYDLSNIFFR